jgi:hypothetical protein
LGIPAFALMLFLDAKLPEAADENIITPFQGLLDQFEKRLDDLG